MQCPRCGYQNAPGAGACGQCGLAFAPLELQQPYGPPPASSGEPGMSGPPGPRPPRPGQYGGPPWSPYQPPNAPPGQYGGGGPGDYRDPPVQPWNRPTGYDPNVAAPPYLGQPGYALPGTYPVGGRATASRGNPVGPLVVMVLAAVAGFGYAGWAVLHRRGIFEDFASGTSTMTLGQARSSDRWDTILLVAAIVLVAAALIWWLVLRVGDPTVGNGLEVGGFVIVGLGIVMAALGLLMSTGVSSAGTRHDEAQKAASAALMYGLGFAVIALGLLVGVAAVRSSSRAGTRPSYLPY